MPPRGLKGYTVMALQLSELKLITASNIIKLRTQAGLTQAELGAKLNYSDKTISKWERGDAIPDAFVLTELAEIFGVSVDYILSSHTDWEPPKEQEDEPPKYSISVIMALTIVGIWTTALTIFVMLRLFDIIVPQVFLVTLPVSLLVYMVLMCVFNRRRHLALVIYLFVLSLLLLLYFFLPVAHPWQIFIIAAPALIIVFLSFNVRSNPGRLARITNKIKRFLKK